jgi:hypothetical protein
MRLSICIRSGAAFVVMIRENLGLIACYEPLTEVGAAILNGKIMP